MNKFLVTAEGQHAGTVVTAATAGGAAYAVFGFGIQTYMVRPSDRSDYVRVMDAEGNPLGTSAPIMSAEYDD